MGKGLVWNKEIKQYDVSAKDSKRKFTNNRRYIIDLIGFFQ